jgi:hypothetical protein
VTWRPAPKAAAPPAPAAGASSSSSGADGGAAVEDVDQDNKGRSLAGRYELSVYTPADTLIHAEIGASYGLSPDFPFHLLYTRSEGSKTISIVSEAVASSILIQQKMPDGTGRVKVVNTGIKVFAENKSASRAHNKEVAAKKAAAAAARAAAAAAAGGDAAGAAPPADENDEGEEEEEMMMDEGGAMDAEDGAAAEGGAGAGAAAASSSSALAPSSWPPKPRIGSLDFRLMQTGLFFLLPYMSRQIVYLSGAEICSLLKFRGQFVPDAVFPARVRKVFNTVGLGSFVAVLHPSLDGCEEKDEVFPAPVKAGAVPLTDAVAVDEAAGTATPRRTVPMASAGAIPPCLRAHYTPSEAELAATAKAGRPAPDHLQLSAGLRVWTGSEPLSRVALCLWKGKARYNVMVHGDEVKGLIELLQQAGYKADA